MGSKSCPECGYPLKGHEYACPECGYPVQKDSEQEVAEAINKPNVEQDLSHPSLSTACKIDLGNYIYECGVIGWNSLKKKGFTFTGRASRREACSLLLIVDIIAPFIPVVTFPLITMSIYGAFLEILVVLALIAMFIASIFLFIPCISVMIRRMHDVGKSGWWSICPIVVFFLFIKKSDEGSNFYGEPFPAKKLL